MRIHAGKLVKFIFQEDCERVILAHNHLNGRAEPSYEDVLETKRLYHLLNTLEISLDDHIIVGENTAYSMAEHHDF